MPGPLSVTAILTIVDSEKLRSCSMRISGATLAA